MIKNEPETKDPDQNLWLRPVLRTYVLLDTEFVIANQLQLRRVLGHATLRLANDAAAWHQGRMTTWTLKAGLEKKFAAGHPWVFSSDLAHSPKGLEPGEPVELRDSAGRFLARGYGHPHTLISFRVLSRDSHASTDSAFWRERLIAASNLRRLSGVFDWSHRLVYAEGDGLPGLIIDRYRLDASSYGGVSGQALVVQSSTAGIDKAWPTIFEALEALIAHEASDGSSPDWARTAVVLANDSKSRELEGVPVEGKRSVKSFSGPLSDVDLSAARIQVQPPLEILPASVFVIDMIGGQKTGFFLDQRSNVQAVSRVLASRLKVSPAPLRVLDLCCYVGQWGSQLAHVGRSFGQRFEVTLVDASQKALELAARNVEIQGGIAHPLKADILDDLGRLANGSFDVVICDPPAFIKKKKDIATGQQAYFKVNREALRKVASGGVFFSSSCSGLFEEEEFRRILARASSHAKEREWRWIWRGSHGPDHPQRPEFPQGTYLKSWMALSLS